MKKLLLLVLIISLSTCQPTLTWKRWSPVELIEESDINVQPTQNEEPITVAQANPRAQKEVGWELDQDTLPA